MNSNEMFNREKKAAKLAAVLFKCGATAEDVINATPQDWLMCSEVAGCLPPHSMETVHAVLEALANLQLAEQKTAQQESDEAAAADDKAEAKWEEQQMNETGADRCPTRE